MLGNIVNGLMILLGSIVGKVLGKFIKTSYAETIMNGVGITVIVMGIENALQTENMMIVIVSIVIGSLIGEVMHMEDKLNEFGNYIGKRVSKREENSFAMAFVNSTLIYCVGSMAILGSLESGIRGEHTILLTKAILDGITSIIFTTTMGIGVAFSSIAVVIYQGTIIILSGALKNFLVEELIVELTAVGGVMMIAIGIDIMKIKKIKIGNMLPALLLPLIYFWVK